MVVVVLAVMVMVTIVVMITEVDETKSLNSGLEMGLWYRPLVIKI
jgi:NADH:ubiquinone oxidoreductase subunit 6 (subunit J)